MGFRTLETSQAAELHIKNGQLEVTTNDGVALVTIKGERWKLTEAHLMCSHEVFNQII